MKSEPKKPYELKPLLAEVAKTMDRVLNGAAVKGTPGTWGFVLIVAPIEVDNAVAEIVYNISTESLWAVLKEAIAREEGRLIEKAGKA